MSDSSLVCLFTSISPQLALEELEYQKSCIASWRAAGFDVVTVNGKTEVVRIEAFKLDAEIVTLGEGGKPQIADILTCAKQRNSQYAGIINADCAFLPYPDLANHLAAQLRGSIAIVERLDIDDNFSPQPDSCSGFDAFFFDKHVVPANFDRGFKIGVPWWDYCFPMAAAVEGARIFNIDTPLLTHKMHHHAWSDEERESVGQIFWRFLKQWRASKQGDFPSFGSELDDLWAEDALTADQLTVVAAVCFRWLQRRRSESPTRFLPANLQFIEVLFQSQRATINRLNHKANATLAELAAQFDANSIANSILVDANSVLELRLANLRKQIEDIERSTSWRLTEPLRKLGEKLGTSLKRRGAPKT
jgi:hypothetical protein